MRHITAVIGQTTAALTDGHFHEEQPGPLSLERDRADAAIEARPW